MKRTDKTNTTAARLSGAAIGRGILSAALVLVMLISLVGSAWLANGGVSAERGMILDDTGEITYINYRSDMKRIASSSGQKQIRMVASSVENDLGITVLNENGDTVTGVAFKFTVTPKDSSKSTEITDEDRDGQVYISDLSAGEYTVELHAEDPFEIAEPVITAKVQPKLSYQKVDVSEKVVEEKDIKVEEEDKKFNEKSNAGAETGESPKANTVDYIESSSKTEEIKTETSILDANGNPTYKYKPALSMDGYLLFADGTASTVIATVDADGYLVAAKRLDVGGDEELGEGETSETQPPAGQEGETQNDPPAEEPQNPPEPPAEPVYTDVLSEIIDADGVPVSDVYRFEKIPQVTVEVKTVTTYYGWQKLNGKTYYYDKNGKAVTGWQIINGVNYFFTEDGSRGGTTDGNLGIDVSTWQDDIDWRKVREAGISFVIIRLGYRGYTKGALVLDSMFKKNIAGATAAGLKVGVYFFTQAVNEQEAIEEASMCLQYVSGYALDYPIAIDMEYSGSSQGRANNLTNAQRTKIAIAFCETVKNGGYIPAVYANKYWFTSMLNTPQLENYVIWLAHYTEQTSYARRKDIWQYSSTGRVNGVNGNVDMNISYLDF